MKKLCLKCNLYKDLFDFTIMKKNGKKYFTSPCKKCVHECKKMYHARPEVIERMILLRKKKYDPLVERKRRILRKKLDPTMSSRYMKKYRERHSLLINARHKERYHERYFKDKLYKKRINSNSLVWKIKNKDRCREYARLKNRHDRSTLHDTYVKSVIQANTKIPRSLIPPLLVDCKRMCLKIKREINKNYE